jgi:ribonuclease HI
MEHDTAPAGELAVPPGQRLVLRTDGASRGNPGHAAAGIVIEMEDGTPVATGKRYLGILTNNQAEYRALILGLLAVARYKPAAVHIYMDSELIVRQMRGEYRVKDESLRSLYEEAAGRVRRLSEATIEHVLRSGNVQADKLANAALDEQARQAGADRG